MSFRVDVHQDRYLPKDTKVITAVIHVRSEGGMPVVKPSEKAVVFVVDTSASMNNPGIKISAARRAAATGIDMLPDGTLFALIAGSHRADCVYPVGGRVLARAETRTRAEAMEVARQLRAEGGTAMSGWIDLVRTLVEPLGDNDIRLAYLVSDGKNESEEPEYLEAALRRAEGIFQCDTRGVGDAYVVSELTRISTVLDGKRDGMARPEEMEADFEAFMDRAIGRSIGDVHLRVRTPGSTVRVLCQDSPEIIDLTGKGCPDPDDQTIMDYPTGAWSGDEIRAYSVTLEVQPANKPKLAAAISLTVGGKEVCDSRDGMAERNVLAEWTDDPQRLTDPRHQSDVVRTSSRQADTVEAIERGTEAWLNGDSAEAQRWLQQAYRSASESGDATQLEKVLRLVDVRDEAPGLVEVKASLTRAEVLAMAMKSRRTAQVDRPEDKPPS